MPAVAPNTDPSTVVNRIADFRPRAEHLAALAAVVVDRRGVSAEAEVAIAVIDDDGVRVRVVGGPLPCRVGRRRSGPGGRPSSAPRERLSRAPGDGRSWRALVERCAPTTVAMAMRLRLLLSHTGARFFDVAKRRSRSKRGLAPDLFLDFVEVFGSRVLRSSYSSLCPDQEHLCRLVLSRPDISGELLVVGQPAVPVDGLAVGRWLRAVEPLSWEGACRWTSELGTPTLTVSPPRLATMVVLSGEARRRRDMAHAEGEDGATAAATMGTTATSPTSPVQPVVRSVAQRRLVSATATVPRRGKGSSERSLAPGDLHGEFTDPPSRRQFGPVGPDLDVMACRCYWAAPSSQPRRSPSITTRSPASLSTRTRTGSPVESTAFTVTRSPTRKASGARSRGGAPGMKVWTQSLPATHIREYSDNASRPQRPGGADVQRHSLSTTRSPDARTDHAGP